VHSQTYFLSFPLLVGLLVISAKTALICLAISVAVSPKGKHQRICQTNLFSIF